MTLQWREDDARATALRRAIDLLCEALTVVDGLQDYPEIGARLDEIVETLGDESGISRTDPFWTDNGPSRT